MELLQPLPERARLGAGGALACVMIVYGACGVGMSLVNMNSYIIIQICIQKPSKRVAHQLGGKRLGPGAEALLLPQQEVHVLLQRLRPPVLGGGLLLLLL